MAVLLKGDNLQQDRLKAAFDNAFKADYVIQGIEIQQERIQEMASLDIPYTPAVIALLKSEYKRLQDEKVRAIKHLEKKQADLQELFAQLPDERMKAVLTLRYQKRMKWADIAAKMMYSVQMVHRLHRKALDYIAGQADKVR